MPPAATKPPTQRKRNRKRKRRAASSSSSSSASDSSEDEAPPKVVPVLPVVPVTLQSQPQPESDSSSSDSDSSESSSSSSDSTSKVQRGRQLPQNVTPNTSRKFSPSPPPPSAALPSFLPPENAGDNDDAVSKEKELKDRFRQFWMTAVADGFRDDLEEIRKVYISSFLLSQSLLLWLC